MDGYGPLVDTKWLADHADAVVIADVRWYEMDAARRDRESLVIDAR